MLRLRYRELGQEHRRPLAPGTAVVGRLESADLRIVEPSVSRRHAILRSVEGRAFVRDLGSRFGTFLNGERVLATRDEVEFRVGDVLTFGQVEVLVEFDVSEVELLSGNHRLAEDPQTVVVPVAPAGTDSGDSPLFDLLAEVGRSLVTAEALPATLQRIVDRLFNVVPAERAFLLLRDSSEAPLEVRVLRDRTGSVPARPSLSRAIVRRVMAERVAILSIDTMSDPRAAASESMLQMNIRSFMCAPLWNRDEVAGVLYADSSKLRTFTPEHFETFTALANVTAVAVAQARLSGQLLEETRRRERLQRYHSPGVVKKILQASGDTGRLSAEERDVTVMFCDLVGFTSICEPLSPAEAASLLNVFLSCMTDVIFAYEGTLDKFIGDALLAIFGAPLDQPDHPRRAVEAALAMRSALVDLNAWLTARADPLQMRIAIHSGAALTGDIGSTRRREFTVLGDVVNTAARLEQEVAGPGDIVISEATYDRVRTEVAVRPLGTRSLRGRTAPIDCFAVEGPLGER